MGSHAEGLALFSVALAVRRARVRPDVPYDVFTLENLAVLGAPYVTAFTQTLVDAIEGK